MPDFRDRERETFPSVVAETALPIKALPNLLGITFDNHLILCLEKLAVDSVDLDVAIGGLQEFTKKRRSIWLFVRWDVVIPRVLQDIRIEGKTFF